MFTLAACGAGVAGYHPYVQIVLDFGGAQPIIHIEVAMIRCANSLMPAVLRGLLLR